MPLTWATMREYILEGILKDNSVDGGGSNRYTPLQLKAFARWAMGELSLHTALADQVVYIGDGLQSVFVLPSDMVDPIERAGLVAYNDGQTINYLPAYKRMPDIIWPIQLDNLKPRRCYWEWPSGRLTLGFVPAANKTITVYYFRIWPAPEEDGDILTLPQWMEQPFVYLVGAAAMESIGTQAANVRQWNRKSDSGNPEQNPAQKQALWFVQQANRILAKVPPQDRESFYQISPKTHTDRR